MVLLWIVALQAAAQPAPVPQRFSVLAPECAAGAGGDVVVCADALSGPRLPRPDDRAPDGPTPSNPHLTGTGALAASGTPCAAIQRGCTVGFGPPIAPIVGAIAGAVKDALAPKPDRTGRVAIPLDPQVPLPGYEPR